MLPELKTAVPGPASLDLAARLRAVECRNTTFTSPDWPVFWERAVGTNVWDADGNRYLDLTSAFGVTGLGHGFAKNAATHQAANLLHAMGDVHPARLKVELCEKLSAITYGRWTGESGKVLLGNSGFEAVESAIKTAVLATGKSGILAFENAYHGLGYGALLGAGIPWFREPFEDQLAAVTRRLEFPHAGDPASVENFRRGLAATDPVGIAAVLAEPMQGRGGIVVPHSSFLSELREWCDLHGVLLILDEIYTGFHRTGALFACEHEKIVPDLICLGKALSGGFPISACVGKSSLMDSWPESTGEALHTSTFLGNPVGCAMAIASIDQHAAEETAERVAETAALLDRALRRIIHPMIREIRGVGLMRGIELRGANGAPSGAVAIGMVTRLLKEGLILLPDGPEGHVLALTPPFALSAEEINFAVSRIEAALPPVG